MPPPDIARQRIGTPRGFGAGTFTSDSRTGDVEHAFTSARANIPAAIRRSFILFSPERDSSGGRRARGAFLPFGPRAARRGQRQAAIAMADSIDFARKADSPAGRRLPHRRLFAPFVDHEDAAAAVRNNVVGIAFQQFYEARWIPV